MDVTRIVINEAEVERITSANGPLGRHISGLADRVVNAAIVNASQRPGPRIRSGDLVQSIGKNPGFDDTFVVDVAGDAQHRGYPYPSRLETGEDGLHYPWLVPALQEVFRNA